ncbi:unnamed protein product, partial [Acanthoscelides obtectus]
MKLNQPKIVYTVIPKSTIYCLSITNDNDNTHVYCYCFCLFYSFLDIGVIS